MELEYGPFLEPPSPPPPLCLKLIHDPQQLDQNKGQGWGGKVPPAGPEGQEAIPSLQSPSTGR